MRNSETDMSRFFSAKWQTVSVDVRPKGWRRIPLISGLPYRTGDDLKLKVRVKVDGSPPTPVVRFTFSDSFGSHPAHWDHSLKGDSTQEFPLGFWHFPNAGQYGVSVEFGSPPPKLSTWSPVHKQTIAVVQVFEDYKPITVFVILAVGAGITKGVEALIGLLS